MEDRLPRKLAAIFYADVAGYSRLTEEDEEGTHRRLSEYLDVISDAIKEHRGRLVLYAGDAVLADFGSATEVLNCSTSIQHELASRNRNLPDERKVQFRIGVNLGEVIVDRCDIYGDGVNVAAGLGSLAEPSGICISESVRTAVGKKLDLDYEFMGEQKVKNIEEPVRAYRVVMEKDEKPNMTSTEKPTLGFPDKPSIAVLPFDNMSGNSEQEYFADGITEDITTALSNVRSFTVTARHSAFAYKGKAIDVRQVGKELGVQYLLEGSVRKAGEEIRVTAQLIETATGKHIWGNRYDGTLEDIFDLQDQITGTIVGTIEPEFQRAEAERISQKRPESLEAYDYLLAGLSYMNKFTPEDARVALQSFRKAIEKDPTYGRAYAYAFWCYRRQVQTEGLNLSKQEQAEAIRLMEAGLKADKDDPVVLWQAGTMKYIFQGDFAGALALFDRSLSIDPNSPRAWSQRALVCSYIGDSETAIEQAEHAIRISPRNPAHGLAHTCIAAAHLQEMRYKEAAEAAKTSVQFYDYMLLAHLILAASCAYLGRLDEARAAIRESLKRSPKLTIVRLPELFPISNFKNLDACLDGLRKAGLPE